MAFRNRLMEIFTTRLYTFCIVAKVSMPNRDWLIFSRNLTVHLLHLLSRFKSVTLDLHVYVWSKVCASGAPQVTAVSDHECQYSINRINQSHREGRQHQEFWKHLSYIPFSCKIVESCPFRNSRGGYWYHFNVPWLSDIIIFHLSLQSLDISDRKHEKILVFSFVPALTNCIQREKSILMRSLSKYSH